MQAVQRNLAERSNLEGLYFCLLIFNIYSFAHTYLILLPQPTLVPKEKICSFFQCAKTEIKLEEENKLQSPEALKQALLGTNRDDCVDAAETIFFSSLVSLTYGFKIVLSKIFST